MHIAHTNTKHTVFGLGDELLSIQRMNEKIIILTTEPGDNTKIVSYYNYKFF